MCLQEDIYFVNTDFMKNCHQKALSIYVDGISLPIYSFYYFRQPSFLFSTAVLFDKDSRLLISDVYHPDWLSPGLSDVEWSTGSGSPAITQYYQGQFMVSSEYHMIAFLVSYTGGFVAYVNGMLVARFDLPANYSNGTLGESVGKQCEYFTIPVSGLSRVSVLSIEVHAPACGAPHLLRVESFPLVDSNAPIFHSVDIILEDGTVYHNPSLVYDYDTWFSIDPELTGSISFKFVNRVSINLSSIELFSLQQLYFRSFSVNSVSYDAFPERLTSIHTQHPIVFRFDKLPLGMILLRLRLHYTSQSTSLCKADSGLGLIEDHSVMLSTCPAGMLGMGLYECTDNQLTLQAGSSCAYPPPGPLVYSTNQFVFYLGFYGKSPLPAYEPTIMEYTVYPLVDIPGLSFNQTTGQFVGTPLGKGKTTKYIIGGSNPGSQVSSSFHVSIEVKEPVCVVNGTKIHLNERVLETAVWDTCLYGKIEKLCVYDKFELGVEEGDRKCYVSIVEICVFCIIVAVSFGSVAVLRNQNKKRKLPIVTIV